MSETLTRLQEELKWSSGRVRANLLTAISCLGAEDAVKTLVTSALSDKNPHVRARATTELYGLTKGEHEPAVRRELIAQIQSEDRDHGSRAYMLGGRLRSLGYRLKITRHEFRTVLKRAINLRATLYPERDWAFRLRALRPAVVGAIDALFLLFALSSAEMGVEIESLETLAWWGLVFAPLLTVLISHYVVPVHAHASRRAAMITEFVGAATWGLGLGVLTVVVLLGETSVNWWRIILGSVVALVAIRAGSIIGQSLPSLVGRFTSFALASLFGAVTLYVTLSPDITTYTGPWEFYWLFLFPLSFSLGNAIAAIDQSLASGAGERDATPSTDLQRSDLSVIEEYLRAENDDVRDGAVQTLIDLGSPESIERLLVEAESREVHSLGPLARAKVAQAKDEDEVRAIVDGINGRLAKPETRNRAYSLASWLRGDGYPIDQLDRDRIRGFNRGWQLRKLVYGRRGLKFRLRTVEPSVVWSFFGSVLAGALALQAGAYQTWQFEGEGLELLLWGSVLAVAIGTLFGQLAVPINMYLGRTVGVATELARSTVWALVPSGILAIFMIPDLSAMFATVLFLVLLAVVSRAGTIVGYGAFPATRWSRLLTVITGAVPTVVALWILTRYHPDIHDASGGQLWLMAIPSCFALSAAFATVDGSIKRNTPVFRRLARPAALLCAFILIVPYGLIWYSSIVAEGNVREAELAPGDLAIVPVTLPEVVDIESAEDQILGVRFVRLDDSDLRIYFDSLKVQYSSQPIQPLMSRSEKNTRWYRLNRGEHRISIPQRYVYLDEELFESIARGMLPFADHSAPLSTIGVFAELVALEPTQFVKHALENINEFQDGESLAEFLWSITLLDQWSALSPNQVAGLCYVATVKGQHANGTVRQVCETAVEQADRQQTGPTTARLAKAINDAFNRSIIPDGYLEPQEWSELCYSGSVNGLYAYQQIVDACRIGVEQAPDSAMSKALIASALNWALRDSLERVRSSIEVLARRDDYDLNYYLGLVTSSIQSGDSLQSDRAQEWMVSEFQQYGAYYGFAYGIWTPAITGFDPVVDHEYHSNLRAVDEVAEELQAVRSLSDAGRSQLLPEELNYLCFAGSVFEMGSFGMVGDYCDNAIREADDATRPWYHRSRAIRHALNDEDEEARADMEAFYVAQNVEPDRIKDMVAWLDSMDDEATSARAGLRRLRVERTEPAYRDSLGHDLYLGSLFASRRVGALRLIEEYRNQSPVYDATADSLGDFPLTASQWNQICWYGSLWGYFDDDFVRQSCDRTVALADPAQLPNVRDSRGINKLLNGVTDSTVSADFQFYISNAFPDGEVMNSEAQEVIDQAVDRRRDWISKIEEFGSELPLDDILRDLRLNESEGLEVTPREPYQMGQ